MPNDNNDEAAFGDQAEGSDNPGGKSKKPENPLQRQLRLEREASSLQASLDSGVFSDIKTKVAWVLNMYPHTRNSDVSLTLKYWELYHSDLYHPSAMNPSDMFKMERATSITRVRAKIQNEYLLFQAEDHVRRRRRSIEEEVKDAAVEDKPERSVIHVFADETGKNAEFVCIASVWVLAGYTLFKLNQAIRTWQDTSPWAGREIHFSEFKKHHIEALPSYLNVIRAHREFLSFKVIGFERSTTKRPIEEVVMRLHEEMLIRGAKHEIESNRVSLPRTVKLTVDAEQSLDKLACSEMKTRITNAYKANHGDDLTVEEVTAISSQKSELVQLADVIAGAVNRRKNHTGDRGYKDDMADLIIEALDIQLSEDDIPDVDATTWLYL